MSAEPCVPPEIDRLIKEEDRSLSRLVNQKTVRIVEYRKPVLQMGIHPKGIGVVVEKGITEATTVNDDGVVLRRRQRV